MSEVRMRDLQRAIDANAAATKALAARVAGFDDAIARRDAERAALEVEKADLIAKVAEAKAETKDFPAERAALKAEIADLTAKLMLRNDINIAEDGKLAEMITAIDADTEEENNIAVKVEPVPTGSTGGVGGSTGGIKATTSGPQLRKPGRQPA